MGTTASAGAATAAAAAGACGPAPGSEGEAAAGGRPTAAKVMAGVATVGSAAGAGAGTTRRRGGDGAIPGRGGGDVIRRERPGVQQKREGVAGINAIGNVGGEEGGEGEEGTAACVNLVQGVGWCAIRETMKRGVSVECNKFEEHNAERSDVKSGGEEQRVKVGVEGGTEGGEG